jgi:hypothetical protein
MNNLERTHRRGRGSEERRMDGEKARIERMG